MKIWHHNFVSHPTVMLLIVSVVPLMMNIGNTSTGMLINADSLAYLYAASHLFPQHAYLNVEGPLGSALTLFPPFYPVLLATINLGTHSIILAAMVLSSVCIFLATVLMYDLLHHLKINVWFALAVTWFIFLHIKIQRLFLYAISECVYLVIVLSILSVLVHAKNKNPIKIGAILGVLVGCGFLTRYIGVTLIPVMVIGLLCMTHAPLRLRIRGIGVALLVSLSIMSLWMWRNYFMDGTFLGVRNISMDTKIKVFKDLLTAVGEMILPIKDLLPYWAWIGGVGIVLMLMLAWQARRLSKEEWLPILPAVTLLIMHMGVLIYSQLTTVLNPMDVRLLSPAIVATALIAAYILKLTEPKFTWPSMQITGVAILFIMVWVPAFQNVRLMGGLQFGYSRYEGNPISLPTACIQGKWPTFSNGANYLYFAHAAPNVNKIPRYPIYRTQEAPNDWPAFLTALRASDACVVWFGNQTTPPATMVLGGDPGPVKLQLFSEQATVYVFKAHLMG